VEVLTACVRVNVILDLFKEFASLQQKELAAAVVKMGGDVVNDKHAMEELARVESKLTARAGSRKDENFRFSFVEFQKEIKDGPEKAIEENAEFFSSKFEIQKRDIQDIVHREGDRIIEAVKAGPHDRIIDQVGGATSSLCITHRSTSTLGYLQHLEGHGG
jgi:hypothetical protein